MYCRIGDLRHKFVINMRNGSRIGKVSDAQFDTSTATVDALVIKGRLRVFGLLGRENDIVVPWRDIEVIGEDTILVNHPVETETAAQGKGIFHILTED